MDRAANSNNEFNTDSPEALFFKLFMTNQKSFYAFILACVHNYTDADDLLQETAAVMWKKFDQFERGTDFLAWGLSIARLRIMKYFNDKTRSKEIFSHDLVSNIAGIVSGRINEMDLRLEAYRICSKKLRPADKNLLDLKYSKGMTTKAISEYLGRPIHGLYKAMARIHKTLLECIERVIARERAV